MAERRGGSLRQEVRERVRVAKQYKQDHKPAEKVPLFTDCADMGRTYGVGLGLYFKCMQWMRVLFLWLALTTIPFLVIINISTFTTEQYSGTGALGVRVFNSFSLQSFTFASIMDDRLDNGTLSWLDVPSGSPQRPINSIPRKTFLQWIAAADAIGMALCVLAFFHVSKLAQQFVYEVDKSTLEVADYTIIVKGLPEVNPIDVGEHFSQWGDVMDVVVVKDCGPLLALAGKATALERKRRAARNMMERHMARAYQKAAEAAEQELHEFLSKATGEIDAAIGYDTKAVFVTFNTEKQRDDCLAACPQRWLHTWLQKRSERFLEQHCFWVEEARPPEDYIYENLYYSRTARIARLVLVRLVVLAMLLLCATLVTKLMSLNISSARQLIWRGGALRQDITAAINAYPSPTPVQPLLANSSSLVGAGVNASLFGTSRFESGGAGPMWEGAQSAAAAGYCDEQLASACSSGLSRLVSTVKLGLGSTVEWIHLPDGFLRKDVLFSYMKDCRSNAGICTLAMCYPCYCAGLQATAPSHVLDGDWIQNAKEQCGDYIDSYDLKSLAIRSLISLVVCLLNVALKTILSYLVKWEKHWTRSEEESAYAIQAFVSQLLNSVVVLLLVNARLDSVSEAINSGLDANKTSRWFQSMILSGAYRDFTPFWYKDVGVSIVIIAVLNIIMPGLFSFIFWLQRKLWQCCLTRCAKTASQDTYNAAWVGPEFMLNTRVCDLMLSIWILLMFGSGMPILYLIGLAWLLVQDVVDRVYLIRRCQRPNRYGPRLPLQLLGVFPWAAAAHCAIGLWMHTYFNGGSTIVSPGLQNLLGQQGQDALALLSGNSLWARITQLNGLPLLVLLGLLLFMYILIRFLLVGMVAKLLEQVFGCHIKCGSDPHDTSDDVTTFEQAIVGSPGERLLAGTATYRLPYHPRYKDLFANPMYKPVYFRAMGNLRFTRVLSLKNDAFEVSSQVQLEHGQADLEETLAELPLALVEMTRKMVEEGVSKANSPTASMTAGHRRGKSISLQVYAVDDSRAGSLASTPRHTSTLAGSGGSSTFGTPRGGSGQPRVAPSPLSQTAGRNSPGQPRWSAVAASIDTMGSAVTIPTHAELVAAAAAAAAAAGAAGLVVGAAAGGGAPGYPVLGVAHGDPGALQQHMHGSRSSSMMVSPFSQMSSSPDPGWGYGGGGGGAPQEYPAVQYAATQAPQVAPGMARFPAPMYYAGGVAVPRGSMDGQAGQEQAWPPAQGHMEGAEQWAADPAGVRAHAGLNGHHSLQAGGSLMGPAASVGPAASMDHPYMAPSPGFHPDGPAAAAAAAAAGVGIPYNHMHGPSVSLQPRASEVSFAGGVGLPAAGPAGLPTQPWEATHPSVLSSGRSSGAFATAATLDPAGMATHPHSAAARSRPDSGMGGAGGEAASYSTPVPPGAPLGGALDAAAAAQALEQLRAAAAHYERILAALTTQQHPQGGANAAPGAVEVPVTSVSGVVQQPMPVDEAGSVSSSADGSSMGGAGPATLAVTSPPDVVLDMVRDSAGGVPAAASSRGVTGEATRSTSDEVARRTTEESVDYMDAIFNRTSSTGGADMAAAAAAAGAEEEAGAATEDAAATSVSGQAGFGSRQVTHSASGSEEGLSAAAAADSGGVLTMEQQLEQLEQEQQQQHLRDAAAAAMGHGHGHMAVAGSAAVTGDQMAAHLAYLTRQGSYGEEWGTEDLPGQ